MTTIHNHNPASIREAMIAVTIGIGDEWNKLAQFAADRMAQMTSLPTFVINESTDSFAHSAWLKCVIMKMFPLVDSFLMFDADLICLRPWNPKGIYKSLKGSFCAVPEPITAPVAQETINYDIRPGAYFNSGLLICGKHHQPIFDDALTRHPRCGSWLEQTSLNLSAFANGGEVTLLPHKFNTLAHGGNVSRVDDQTVNVHFCSTKSAELILNYGLSTIELYGEKDTQATA